MPMPQRNSRRVAPLLSNNTSLFSGVGTTSSTGLNNYANSGSTNNNNSTTSSIISPSNNSSSTASNGRLYGNPVAHQPPPPPLITDTLTACLDVNGTYICTSYSPRCYIIQKVTPNTVTVTPHVIGGGNGGGGETGSATGAVTGSNPHVVGPSPLTPVLSASSASVRKQKQFSSDVSLSASSSSSPSHHFLSSSHSTSHSSSSAYSHSHRHFQGSSYNGSQHIQRSSAYIPQRSSGGECEKGCGSSSRTCPPGCHSSHSGRAYMNGEVGSTTATFVGEESTPAMVHQSSSGSGAGTQISENRSLNGVKDGMPREHMKSIDSSELLEDADISRRNDPGNGANPGASDLSREDLKRQLLQQLEYYFSPENLANDKFLVSQMDSDHYVFISTIANFNLVKRLTGDIDLVTEALRDSKNVQVHSDGKRVRPVSHRTVVILRGIPQNTPVDEIKALFDSENCPKCNSCEFAFNDSWYVSFESDEDAQRAHRYLREDVKEFKGQPIMARIKSRPTTLLAQGAGVHLKNGFHQPAQVVGYIPPAAFVPGSQTGPTSAVAPTPMYPHGQTVPPVFPIPPNYNYGPWANTYYQMGPEQLSQMFSVNGLPPQHQTSSTYPKSLPMNTRPRNPSNQQTRLRRPPPPSGQNESQGMNGVVGASGTNSAVAAHQSYGNPPRKSNTGPPPLLNLVQNTPSLPLGTPTSHNHHSQGHLPHSTHSNVQVQGGNTISQNGSRHYGSNLPSSHSLDSYHPTGSMRPYNNRGVNDSRPRSSLSNRKGPTTRREDEGSYEGPSASLAALPPKVPSARGAPPNIPAPQPAPVENLGPQQPPGKINFDLEGSAFPPLPGSGLAAGKNGDAVFEGRLSDVVKGVKNMKAPSAEKEEAKPNAGNAPTEIIVSVEENQGYGDVREVSAASPVKDLEVEKKPEQSSQSSVQSGKKEFREVGVGSADDTHDIRSSHYKSSLVGGARNKETADKSTRTDEALLNGDQSQAMKTGSTQTPLNQNGGNRRSAAAQSMTNKSPIPGKRTVPATQGQPNSSTVSVGPEVPYSSRAVTSPVTSPTKPAASQTTLSGGNGGSNAGISVTRGANPYVAKPSGDNNNSRANGMVSSSSGSNLIAVDKDAFPSPGFVKSVPSSKPFPDQTPKEVTRTDADKDRKESGQGDAKKNDDCSSEERDGPVRLSYAQVAQARKETGGSSSSSHPVSAGNCVSSANSSSSASVAQSSSSSIDEKRKPNPKEAKDVRPPPKNPRNSGGGERDGRFRRGFRNRMSSDHSDSGSTGASGESGRRPLKPSRSPK